MASDAEIGECVVRHEGPDLYIQQAPPRVWLAAGMLDLAEQGQLHPAVSFVDSVLKIRAKNQTVIYRVRPYICADGADLRTTTTVYVGEWPD